MSVYDLYNEMMDTYNEMMKYDDNVEYMMVEYERGLIQMEKNGDYNYDEMLDLYNELIFKFEINEDE